MRLLTMLLLALTALSAWRVTCLRPTREIFIQGRLALAAGEPVKGAKVDVILIFPATKLKITPQGRQLVALRTLGAGEQWHARPDAARSYAIKWRPGGDFEIIIKLPCPSKPRRCRLIYRLAGAELHSPRFLLQEEKTASDRWAGFCPAQLLSALPTSAPPSAAPDLPPAEPIEQEETPEQEMSESGIPLAEGQEIHRTEFTLQHINTLSPMALRMRYQLLRYLEQHPDLPTRTRQVGTLVRDILDRRLALLGILRSGEAVWVRPGEGLKLLRSDPDEHEAEETVEIHQESAPRFED
ncbi:MAG: hypothetical protein KF760_18860 [Candidatus Eremiobacteraeota bacterium]|nr:hypothetical protein [Candidatus Eremiobacteraeota bacterium]MCW5868460.1 hypothetical protein [Candidatus Eremiobacteraeota bacterium]